MIFAISLPAFSADKLVSLQQALTILSPKRGKTLPIGACSEIKNLKYDANTQRTISRIATKNKFISQLQQDLKAALPNDHLPIRKLMDTVLTWYTQNCPDATFSWCSCHSYGVRMDCLFRILSFLIEKFPDRNKRITYLSCASGELLQDVITLLSLVALGYTNITYTCIDMIYREDIPKGLDELLIENPELFSEFQKFRIQESELKTLFADIPTVEIHFLYHSYGYLRHQKALRDRGAKAFAEHNCIALIDADAFNIDMQAINLLLAKYKGDQGDAIREEIKKHFEHTSWNGNNSIYDSENVLLAPKSTEFPVLLCGNTFREKYSAQRFERADFNNTATIHTFSTSNFTSNPYVLFFDAISLLWPEYPRNSEPGIALVTFPKGVAIHVYKRSDDRTKLMELYDTFLNGFKEKIPAKNCIEIHL